MATINGYISMASLADNRANIVAQFGEFSTKVDTFTRDPQHFQSDTMPGVQFVGLYAEDNNNPWVITSTVGTQILTIGKWVYDQYLANLIPRNTSKAAFIAALTTQFPTCNDFTVGELLAGPASNKNMPDYIRFNIGALHNVRIWFADSSIKSQYDIYEVNVIPPIQSVAMFDNHLSAVQTAIINRSLADIRHQAEAIIGEDPPTYDTVYSLTWKDPTGSGATLETTWTVIGYGPLSTEEEAIKDAIKQYLTDNAPSVDWSKIFPSLYSASEFVIVPMWKQTSPATEGLDLGSYSPFVLVNDIKTIVTGRLPIGYSAATNISTHLNSYLQVFGFIWRSITLAAVGSPSNLGTNRKISSIVPDMLNVPTTNADYGRMAPDTALFMEKLTNCLEVARNFTPTSVAPAGLLKRISGGRIYLTFNHGEYKIMVLTKFGYDTLI